MKPFLFVALDDLTKQERNILEIAKQLSEVEGDFGFKINLDYLLKKGIQDAVENVKQFGRPVFADLKMWNGGRTMTSVIENLVSVEVEYLNVYALADDLLPEAIKIVEDSKTKVLGLTVLTHYSEDYCQKHFHRSLREAVRHFAEVAIEVGCHGILLPGPTLEIVQDIEIIKAVSGVRPEWFTDNRHKEVIEPGEAIRKGALILVCGSPIMKNVDIVKALKKILAEMRLYSKKS